MTRAVAGPWHDRERLAAERGPGGGLVALGALLAAVVEPGEGASPYVEGDQVLGVGDHHAPGVDDLGGDEGQRAPVRRQGPAVGGEAHGVRPAGRAQDVGGDGPAVPAGHGLQLAGRRTALSR